MTSRAKARRQAVEDHISGDTLAGVQFREALIDILGKRQILVDVVQQILAQFLAEVLGEVFSGFHRAVELAPWLSLLRRS